MIDKAFASVLVAECMAQQTKLRELAFQAREKYSDEDAKPIVQGIGCILGAMELDLLADIFKVYPELEPGGDHGNTL